MKYILHYQTGWRARLFYRHGLLGRFSIFVFCVMIYMMVCASASIIYIDHIANHWQKSLSEAITIEIPYQENKNNARQQALVNSVIEKASSINGVADAQLLDDNHINELLAFWFAEEFNLSSLKIPILIAITKDIGGDIDMALLTQAVKSVAPDARINAHNDWLERVLDLSWLLYFAIIFLILSLTISCLVMVVFMIKSLFALNYQTIEVLVLMGASGRFIINNLTFSVMKEAFIGAILACVLSLLSYIFILFFINLDDILIQDAIDQKLYLWCLLCAPILLMAIFIVAYKTIVRILSTMNI